MVPAVTPREDRPVTPSKPGKGGDRTPDRQISRDKKSTDTKERKRYNNVHVHCTLRSKNHDKYHYLAVINIPTRRCTYLPD